MLLAILAMPSVSRALDVVRAERVFAQHCAVCHGADRGGYVAPALLDNRPAQLRLVAVVVHKVRAGLNGTSLAVSRDGRYVAAGSYVPRTMVILDANTLEPVRLLELAGVDPGGKMVQADAGIITATPFANVFVVAFEQAGEVWIVDLEKTDMPVTTITGVGRHLHDGFLSHDGRVLVVFSYDDHHNAVIDLAEARVVRKIPAGCQPHLGSGTLGHSHFREYTASGDYFYVSARYRGDRSMGAPGGRLVIFDSRALEEVKSIVVDVPAGLFSRSRARSVVVGLQE